MIIHAQSVPNKKTIFSHGVFTPQLHHDQIIEDEYEEVRIETLLDRPLNTRNQKMFQQLTEFAGELNAVETSLASLKRGTESFLLTSLRALRFPAPKIYPDHVSVKVEKVDRKLTLGSGCDENIIRQALDEFRLRIDQDVLQSIEDWKLGYRSAATAIEVLNEQMTKVSERIEKFKHASKRISPKVAKVSQENQTEARLLQPVFRPPPASGLDTPPDRSVHEKVLDLARAADVRQAESTTSSASLSAPAVAVESGGGQSQGGEVGETDDMTNASAVPQV